MFKQLAVAAVVAAAVLTGATATADDKATVNAKVAALWKVYEPLREAKKWDEALAVLAEVNTADPTNAYGYSEAAYIHNERADYPAAVTVAEKALEANVDHSNGWRELGYALMMQKRHDDATKALRSAIDKDWQNWFAYDYYADNFEKQGKFAAAKEIRAAKVERQAKAKEPAAGK